MYNIFQTRKINCTLRSQTDFANNCINTNKFGLNSQKYLASLVCSMVPLQIKDIVKIFKTKIRNWKPKDCYCHLCKIYIKYLAFVNLIQMPCFIVKKLSFLPN